MSACQHIASRLMALLVDNDIRQMTTGALQQFNLDVMQCERESPQAFVLTTCYLLKFWFDVYTLLT